MKYPALQGHGHKGAVADLVGAAQKPSRTVSRSSLMKAALHYLGRFSASRAGVRLVLVRKVKSSLARHGGDEEESLGWVESVLDELQKQGWLDDHAFAATRARTLANRGTPRHRITMELAEKGVDSAAIVQALEQLDEEQGIKGQDWDRDIAAALAYARRRRLGPWQRDADRQTACRDKDLRALARRGFSFATADKILNAESIEEAEDLLLDCFQRR